MIDGHAEIMKMLTEIKVSQATHTANQKNMANDVKEIKDDVKITNGRVGKLERWRSGIVASIGVIVFAVGLYIKLRGIL